MANSGMWYEHLSDLNSTARKGAERAMGTDFLLYKLAASFGAGLVMYWMNLEVILRTLVLFMIADLVSGAVTAAIQSRFSARQLLYGFYRKSMSILLLWMLDAAEKPLGADFHIEHYLVTVLFVYEMISIMDNVAAAGGLPSPIITMIEKIKKILATVVQTAPDITISSGIGDGKTAASSAPGGDGAAGGKMDIPGRS